ncbi:hypothetical protein LIER_18988 [Lithospermum erythrorhizon]|uniref:Uncharacterized protein n=1 Tax=Lithospermum erythrorhizon TaxID=34254 RepID=A0AAV3QJ60_LITER
MDNYELRPRDNPNNTECSRPGEMSPPATQVPSPQVARGSVPSTTPAAAEGAEEVCHREGKAPMLAYDGKYLETPFQIPNLKVSLDPPWNARKFHYHLTRPFFSEKMAAQYKPLRDPCAALTQSIKQVVLFSLLSSINSQAVNGTHI